MRTLIYALLVTCLAYSSQTLAQSLQIPISQQGAEQTTPLPEFGQSQQHVLAQYGEPKKRHPSIGQPPITRWDYPYFTVYFEYQTVINSVKHHTPAVKTP